MTGHSAKIGLWHGAGLLATTLLGTSVFILPQITIDIAQNAAVWGWLALTLAIIPVTLVFGRLAAHYPHAAGPAFFVEKAFGAVAGRTIGLIFLCAVPLGVPAGILMTFQFINALFTFSPLQAWLVQLLMLVLIFALNYRGIKISAKLQLMLTLAIVVVVLTMLVLAGATDTGNSLNLSFNQSDLSPTLLAAGLAFWSFLGVEAMAHLSGDFENPKRDLLPAMLIGTTLVGGIYIACTAILLTMDTHSPLAMAGVFDQLVGGGGKLVICVLGIAGGLATVNVYTASTARLMWSFSEDRVLPAYFKKRNQHQVAARALIVLLMIMAIVLTFTFATDNDLDDLIFWVNGVFIIIYLAAMLAAIRLLEGNHLAIGMSIMFCVAIMWGLGWQMSYAVILMLAISPLAWWQKHLHIKRDQRIVLSK